VSAQEILMEEIKHQPEPVLREVLNFLKQLKRQREAYQSDQDAFAKWRGRGHLLAGKSTEGYLHQIRDARSR
jgi:hypothetical protein